MRAVLLGRVSTDDKDQDPENQLRPLREAAARKGWTVVREISKHLSAWDNRAAEAVWRECLEPIRNGEADVLCVWSLDRLSRRGAEDVFAKIRVLEEHYGAQFYSLIEPFLSTAADPMQRELVLPIISWAAKFESQLRSERLKASYRAKRAHASAGAENGRARWGRGRVPNDADIERIRFLRRGGMKLEEISRRLELSMGTIWNVLHDDRFRPASGT